MLRRLLREPEVVKTVNDLDENGMSALHYAARNNSFEAVALLLKQGNAGRTTFIICILGMYIRPI